jgi:hypothetical protein
VSRLRRETLRRSLQKDRQPRLQHGDARLEIEDAPRSAPPHPATVKLIAREIYDAAKKAEDVVSQSRREQFVNNLLPNTRENRLLRPS